MADFDLSATINRDLLGLDPLQLAGGEPYYLDPKFLGGQVSWDRQQASSRWVDGDVTTSRRRGTVTEQVGVEIRGDSIADVQAATIELIEAFTQDHYTMSVTINGTLFVYDCEAADYTNAMWSTPRVAAAQGKVVFSVPRRPIAAVGV